MKQSKKTEPKRKPIMVIEYVSEHDTAERYIYDYAADIGIPIDENNPYDSFDYICKHEIYPKGNFDFCWAQEKFISIKEMEKFISVVKEFGATHLDIHFHTDHGNYNLHAVAFREATEKELVDIAKLKDRKNKEKIKEIDAQIKQLEKQKKKLEA